MRHRLVAVLLEWLPLRQEGAETLPYNWVSTICRGGVSVAAFRLAAEAGSNYAFTSLTEREGDRPKGGGGIPAQ